MFSVKRLFFISACCLSVCSSNYVDNNGGYLNGHNDKPKPTDPPIDPTPPKDICALPQVTLPNNSLAFQALQKELIHKGWKIPLLANLSPLVAESKEIILAMGDADSVMHNYLAFVITVLDQAYIPNAETLYPNFCQYAKVINKTVEWAETKNQNSYVEAVNETATVADFLYPALTYTALKGIGCKNVTELNVKSESCWQNGFATEYEGMWHHFGSLLPCCLHNVVDRLIKSPVFSDRAQGLLITVALSPFLSRFLLRISEDEFIYSKAFENIYIYNSIGVASKCCCDEWNKKMDQNNAWLTADAYELAKDVINDELLCDGKITS